jgi:hypothetical protein
MLFNATMCEEDRVDLRESRKEQLAMDDGGVDSREYRARDYSQREDGKNTQVATAVMVKTVSDAD